jgi:antirestriction protein ArdC
MDTKIKAVMASVVEALVSLVETAGAGWVKPWVNLGLGRQYRSNGELYRGTNQMFLGMIAVGLGFELPHIWAGYDSWHEAGWTVRKGEKSPYTPIWAYTVVSCKEHGKPEDADAPKCCDNQFRFRRIKLVRPVWHRSQVENITEVGYCNKGRCDLAPEDHVEATLPAIPTPPEPTMTPPEIVEAWKAGGMVFKEVDDGRAFYDVKADYINLPPVGAFVSESGFYSTLLHEATHWTGHESRLGRPNLNAFGSTGYAMEELVAEIGAAMVAALLDLELEPHPEHGEYLKSWLKALADDPSKLYEAAVEAERGTEMLMALGRVMEVAA